MLKLEWLEALHVLLAMASGLGFALRGFIRRVLERPLDHPVARIGPHLLDTVLLASGGALWIAYRYDPLTQGWLGLKLLLILIYIGLGFAAFRIEQHDRAVLPYAAALLVFIAIAVTAAMKPS